MRALGSAGEVEERRQRAGHAAAGAGGKTTAHALVRASRHEALDGRVEGDDAVPMEAPARALVVGVHGNRHRGERRASAGGEDENEHLRRWRPSHVDYSGTEMKGQAANLSVVSIWAGSSELDGIVLGGASAPAAVVL